MTIKFDSQKNSSSIIKVIGVGGGGSNAVNFMFSQGIKDVDFIVTNTDKQALEKSPIPVKIQLGSSITEGWGAGAIPETGRKAAMETIDEIKEHLNNNTKMVFITAGLGGGTGTGAAPVIAQIAKEMGILTVGIVTLPFSFEGRKRQQQAVQGLDELRNNVDTLLVICNDKLRELHGDLKLSDAFHKADNILTIAAKGIAEIITVTGHINVDFNDVNTVMRDSGVAIMGTGIAEGTNRAVDAVEMALSSPLLNDNDINGAKDVLLYLSSGAEEISMDEVTEITDYIQNAAGSTAEIIWGNGTDDTLDNKISVTLIATGFKTSMVNEGPIVREPNVNKVVNTLDEAPKTESILPAKNEVVEEEMKLIIKSPEPKTDKSNTPEKVFNESDYFATSEMENSEKEITVELDIPKNELDVPKKEDEMFLFTKSDNSEESKVDETSPSHIFDPINKSSEVKSIPDEEANLMINKNQDRVDRLKKMSLQIKNQEVLAQIEKTPAYLRRNVTLEENSPSNESSMSTLSLNTDDSNNTEFKQNSYLHDNVD